MEQLRDLVDLVKMNLAEQSALRSVLLAILATLALVMIYPLLPG